MNSSIIELVDKRFSCRNYLARPIEEEKRREIEQFLEKNSIGPLGTKARFALIAATPQDEKALKGLGTYGMIKGATGFLVGAVKSGRKNLEDFGYLTEHAILAATDLGLGSCWLGGSFSKSSFGKRIGLQEDECIPAVVSIGYSATNGRSGFVQKFAKAGFRRDADELFFENRFGQPLSAEKSAQFSNLIKAVRWAPSASNLQPWRIVQADGFWHFYLERTKGYGKDSLVAKLFKMEDLQRVDIGIAMCHFELCARELGFNGGWTVQEPDIEKPTTRAGMEYISSWRNLSG